MSSYSCVIRYFSSCFSMCKVQLDMRQSSHSNAYKNCTNGLVIGAVINGQLGMEIFFKIILQPGNIECTNITLTWSSTGGILRIKLYFKASISIHGSVLLIMQKHLQNSIKNADGSFQFLHNILKSKHCKHSGH